jgi:hypothetical protein
MRIDGPHTFRSLPIEPQQRSNGATEAHAGHRAGSKITEPIGDVKISGKLSQLRGVLRAQTTDQSPSLAEIRIKLENGDYSTEQTVDQTAQAIVDEILGAEEKK